MLTAAIVVLGLACSASESDETEVAGVVLDQDTSAEASSASGAEGSEGPAGSAGPDALPSPDDRQDEPAIPPLVVLRSGPATVGASWLAAAGAWVQLDGQSLERGTQGDALYLDAAVAFDAAQRAVPEGCLVRVVAPEAADLHAAGVVSVELVVEVADRASIRTVVDDVELALELAPGERWELTLLGAETLGPVDADQDVVIRCEGRFDRS